MVDRDAYPEIPDGCFWSISFAGHLYVGRQPLSTSEAFQFVDARGRLLADCVDYESLLAAHRLLVGGAP